MVPFVHWEDDAWSVWWLEQLSSYNYYFINSILNDNGENYIVGPQIISHFRIFFLIKQIPVIELVPNGDGNCMPN